MDKIKGLAKVPQQWIDCKNTAERKKLIKELWKTYKEVFWYLVFGVCTTIVNVVSYVICMDLIGLGNIPSNVVAWILAVVFAYFANRNLVFHSENHTRKSILKEVIEFFAARVATGVFDLGFMFVTVNLLVWPDVWMKIISNIIVIILNFILQKFLVFAKKDK